MLRIKLYFQLLEDRPYLYSTWPKSAHWNHWRSSEGTRNQNWNHQAWKTKIRDHPNWLQFHYEISSSRSEETTRPHQCVCKREWILRYKRRIKTGLANNEQNQRAHKTDSINNKWQNHHRLAKRYVEYFERHCSSFEKSRTIKSPNRLTESYKHIKDCRIELPSESNSKGSLSETIPTKHLGNFFFGGPIVELAFERFGWLVGGFIGNY